MKLKITFITSLICLSHSAFTVAQKVPVIIATKAVEPIAKPAEPSFSGDQISFGANEVTFKEKAGFKTEKIEVQNADKVILDKTTMTFRVINAERILTSIKIQKMKTTDPQKIGLHYKLNDDVVYIYELSEEPSKK